eukprot:1161933-Pelagomonas_calceolata.AAC.5
MSYAGGPLPPAPVPELLWASGGDVHAGWGVECTALLTKEYGQLGVLALLIPCTGLHQPTTPYLHESAC